MRGQRRLGRIRPGAGPAFAAVLAGAGAALPAVPAAAQALGPMRGEVASAAGRFALQLRAVNYLQTDQVYAISVFDPDWKPVEDARATTWRVRVGPESSTPFIVTVPFGEGDAEREVLVCSTSEPFPVGGNQMIRGKVCGRYRGRRLSPLPSAAP